MKKINNYERWCEEWKEKFLKIDQKELQRKLPEIKKEREYLTIYHFGRKFGIHKENGNIIALEDSEKVTCYEKLNIYTLFWYVSPFAYYKNDWVPFDKLKGTSPFSKAFQNAIIKPLANMFDGHRKELEIACEKLTGKRLTWSDVGFELNAFECIPIRFLFWEGDEEFPSQGNVLFDFSATDYIHGESIVTIAAIGLDRIVKKAGMIIDRSTFPIF